MPVWIRTRTAQLLAGAAVGLAACAGGGEDGPAPGAEGWPCTIEFDCRVGFTCVNQACTAKDRDAGAPEDAGVVPDAGPPDGGTPDTGVDAGPVDTGCPVPPRLSAIQSEIFGGRNEPACNQAGCHGVSASGGLRLDTPIAQLRSDLLRPTVAAGAPQTNLVVPGDPAASRLYVLMSDRNPGGNGDPMPPDAPVDYCSADTVRRWILDDAPAN